MSVVTDVLIVAGYVPDETRDALLAGYDDRNGRRVNFGNLNSYSGGTAQAWGGGKFASLSVFAGAFNHFVEDECFDWLRSLKWWDAPGVVLLDENVDVPRSVLLDVPSRQVEW